MFDSTEYWRTRYLMGGTSGVGSFGEFAKYKAMIVNGFVREKNIHTVLDMGCGDGNQIALFEIPTYVGYDVSCIHENTIRFPQCLFVDDLNGLGGFDMTLSLDVVFHLIEDDVYMEYMTDLFALSDDYVMIYAPNEDRQIAEHVKYRAFIKDIPHDFTLVRKIINPLKCRHTQSDFYIFKRI